VALASALWLGLVGLAVAEDKDTKDDSIADKLIGRWEAVKGTGLPAGAIVEFRKDGKMTMTVKDKEGKEQKMEATYKVKGKSFDITMKRNDETRTMTIKVTRITDKEMETEGSKGEMLTLKKLAGKGKKKE
jgi:uncharacterized protein (TIGR03066 family)